MTDPPGLVALLDGVRKLREEGDIDGALDLVGQAVDRFPDRPRAWLTFAHLTARHYEEGAAQLLERAYEVGPLCADDLARAGAVHLILGELDQAEEALDEAEERDDLTLHARVATIRGILAEELGDLAEAEQRFRLALAAEPERRENAVLLARLLVRRGRPAEALETVRDGLGTHAGDFELTALLRDLATRLAGGASTTTGGGRRVVFTRPGFAEDRD